MLLRGVLDYNPDGALFVHVARNSDGDANNIRHVHSALVFMSTTGKGFQITYPSITLHAISRSGEGPASIYCQLDETDYSQTPMTTATNGTGEGEEEVTEMQEMRELHIISSKPENRACQRFSLLAPHQLTLSSFYSFRHHL